MLLVDPMLREAGQIGNGSCVYSIKRGCVSRQQWAWQNMSSPTGGRQQVGPSVGPVVTAERWI